MDKFDTSVSLIISSVVGAGVFALPVIAGQLGLMSAVFILVAFVYMLGLGYVIIEMTPGTVEEEVEIQFGKKMKLILRVIEYGIMFLALVSYIIGLKAHLPVHDFLIFSILALPLILELHFPAVFTQFLAFFILVFLSALTLGTVPSMEIPSTLFSTSGVKTSSMISLFLASIFAFFGHNMIPRIRTILRNKNKTKKAFYTALSIVFLLYLPFTIAVSGTGVSGIATEHLASFFSNPFSSIIDLLAVVVFYTSFVIFGLHLMGDFGFNLRGLLIVVLGTLFLYVLTNLFRIPFHIVIASAGFGVSMYAAIVSLTAIKAKKLVKFAYYLLGMTLFIWLFLLAQLFV